MAQRAVQIMEQTHRNVQKYTTHDTHSPTVGGNIHPESLCIGRKARLSNCIVRMCVCVCCDYI